MQTTARRPKQGVECRRHSQVGPGSCFEEEPLIPPADCNMCGEFGIANKIVTRKLLAPIDDVCLNRQNKVGMHWVGCDKNFDAVGLRLEIIVDWNESNDTDQQVEQQEIEHAAQASFQPPFQPPHPLIAELILWQGRFSKCHLFSHSVLSSALFRAAPQWISANAGRVQSPSTLFCSYTWICPEAQGLQPLGFNTATPNQRKLINGPY